MALAIHVIAHKLTDAILASCTRAEGGDPDELVAQLVGDSLPVRTAVFGALGSIAAADLVVEKVPGKPELTPGGVLDRPLEFRIIRDAQGKAVQSIEKPQVITPSVSQKKLQVDFPAQIALDGVAAWVRLIDATGTPLDQPVLIKPKDFATSTTGYAQLTADVGSYTLFVLVKGYAAGFATVTLS